MDPESEAYFNHLEAEVEAAYTVARRARERGEDPTEEVEIPIAKDMADRVQNLLGISGVAERVRELETEMSREEAALALAVDFAEGRVGDAEDPGDVIEDAVRTSVALLTEGVVAAPIEGIDSVEVLTNDDGSTYVSVEYAGPIRSAGGTAQALSVLVADYTRNLLGVGAYRPRADEIERYVEEVALYDADTGLQYSPSSDETRHIARNCPIHLDGEPTSEREVSGYRDLERVDTNRARGGMCLVLAEGIALKAPKIQRYTRTLEPVDWPWLEELMSGVEDEEVTRKTDDEEADTGWVVGGYAVPEPSDRYLRDLIAGRPVFAHPSRPGGFRLRYGRARNHGFATAGVHPATMRLLDDFLAPGTQIKTERPGKAAGVVPVDTIEGPTVKLRTGEVRRIDDPIEAREIRNGVEAILDVGEYLVNPGEFVENNYNLAPAGYAVEWWEQEFHAAGGDIEALRDDPSIDLVEPEPSQAIAWAMSYDAPLHPAYTYLWHDVSATDVASVANAVREGCIDDDTLRIENTETVRRALEEAIVPHVQSEAEITISAWQPVIWCLGYTATAETIDGDPDIDAAAEEADGLAAVNSLAPFTVRAKAPSRIGNRMGRPEKSESRELSPAVHTLFPIASAGGDQRNVTDATGHAETMDDQPGVIELEMNDRRCPRCGDQTYRTRCPDCAIRTDLHWECDDCGTVIDDPEEIEPTCPRCERTVRPVARHTVNIDDRYHEGLDRVGERETAFQILKGVKGLMSAEMSPEPMEKGILRAKHDISAFKDGTVRYDMTDLPVTAVRPEELSVPVERFRALGYDTDIHGDPLEHDDQVIELKVQDIVLSTGAGEHLTRTANFVDDLLESFYDMEPYYEVDEPLDLVGELAFGLAPHTSAAVVGRIVGFTDAAVGYAHPYFHAAKRRNCFHPETKIRFEGGDGEWREMAIETFVEDRLSDPERDDFGTEYTVLDGDGRVLSVDSDGRQVVRSVEAVSKHPAPDHMVRIGTEGGHSLTVTPDHPLLRWDRGVERIDASEISVGDGIPVAADPVCSSSLVEETPADGGQPTLETITRVETVRMDRDYTYCLTVPESHSVFANDLASSNCDGDEDCVMLLMDGLLNFSKKYLPDRRGGSVAEDSTLLAVSPEGDINFITFDQFWDGLKTPVRQDGKFEKKFCFKEGWQTYVFDDRHRAKPKPIEKAIRYRAATNETLLKVETQFGRSIEITGDHSLFRYDDGIEEVAGTDLDEGDLILAPRTIPVEPTKTTIDVTKSVDQPAVVIDEDVKDRLTTVSSRGGDARSPSKMELASRLETGTIPFERFERILESASIPIEAVDAEITRAGATRGISRFIDIEEDFAWLLGVFVADGTLSTSNPVINNAKPEVVNRVTEISRSVLGRKPNKRRSNGSYEVTFPSIFEDVLYSLGFEKYDSDNSSEMVIPQCILQAPRPVVLAFLRGMMAREECITRDATGTTVSFYSTSQAVKDGIVLLLHRLGIVPNISSQKNRPANRNLVWTVTVSGGKNDNPLRRVFEGEEPYLPKNLVVRIPERLMEIREMDIEGVRQIIPRDLKHRKNISLEKLSEIVHELERQNLPHAATRLLKDISPLFEGDLSYLKIETIEEVEYNGYLYDLQVGGEPIFTTNWLYAHNSMDAPLVMSSRIDPAEIDDEAHNIDIVDELPLSFYEATLEAAHPEETELHLAEETVGTEYQYRGFSHTHDVSDIAMGPDLSAYKTLDSMMDKMEAQLELARKLRPVDSTDVAERVIESHFLPDLIGNLRAFSSQETRCLGCGTKYRRVPLTRTCRLCGGDMTLTVHEGSVKKYMDTALRIAEQYGCREYTIQRLQLLDRSLESLFEDDHNKQSGIADFM